MFQPACLAESAPSPYACLVCPAPRLYRGIARLWSRPMPVLLDLRMRATDEAFDPKSANPSPLAWLGIRLARRLPHGALLGALRAAHKKTQVDSVT